MRKKCPLQIQGVDIPNNCEEKYCEWWDDNQCVVHSIKDWLKDIADHWRNISAGGR